VAHINGDASVSKGPALASAIKLNDNCNESKLEKGKSWQAHEREEDSSGLDVPVTKHDCFMKQ